MSGNVPFSTRTARGIQAPAPKKEKCPPGCEGDCEDACEDDL